MTGVGYNEVQALVKTPNSAVEQVPVGGDSPWDSSRARMLAVRVEEDRWVVWMLEAKQMERTLGPWRGESMLRPRVGFGFAREWSKQMVLPFSVVEHLGP